MSLTVPAFPFLAQARLQGATDLTVSAGRPARARVAQGFFTLPAVDGAEFARFSSQFGRELHPLDVGSFTHEGQRHRYLYYHSESGPTFELRHLPQAVPSLEALGVPPAFHHLIRAPRGLVIVTGATGSGKTTTLAAALDRLNETGDDLKILTLEDPIEYLHPEKKAVIRQCEYRRDFPDFPSAIRALMRQDPDVALIGELRDPESVSAALSAAETGHLVFTTLHTKDAAGSVSRILDAAPGADALAMLAGSLVGVLAQQLVPALDGGRLPVFELLVSTTAVRTCIREKRIDHLRDEIRRGQGHGMVTMDDSLLVLYRRHRISEATLFDYAHDREDVQKKLSLPCP
ncbi:MAG: type IV pilus twitching motility protein PilT [Opitutales bacterium]